MGQIQQKEQMADSYLITKILQNLLVVIISRVIYSLICKKQTLLILVELQVSVVAWILLCRRIVNLIFRKFVMQEASGCFGEACLREAFHKPCSCQSIHHPSFSARENTNLKSEMPCFFVLYQILLCYPSPYSNNFIFVLLYMFVVLIQDICLNYFCFSPEWRSHE